MTHKNNPSIALDCLSFIVGALMVLAFAPFSFWPFAISSPTALCFILNRSTPKRAALRGFLFGLGLFGFGVSWVYVSIHDYGGVSLPLAILITLLFVAGLSLCMLMKSYCYRVLFSRHNAARSALAFAGMWVLFELFRSWVFGGFPWLLLGYGVSNTPLVYFAPLFSIFGISLVTATIAGLLNVAIDHKCIGQRSWPIAIIILLFLTGFALKSVNWTTPIGKTLTVSLVQGNIPVDTKWDPSSQVKNLETYFKLSKHKLGRDIIVWPENAVPIFKSQATPFIKLLNEDADAKHSSILFGLPIDDLKTDQYFNGAMVVGNGFGTYKKRHLVPFGEYIPLQGLFGGLLQFLDIPMSSFTPGPNRQNLLRMQDARVALFICYETAYPTEVRRTINNANLLISISDDGWFGDSIGPIQHEQIAQMRALETGRYLLRDTNTGVTSIISPKGEIIAKLPSNQRAVLDGKIHEMRGSTPWMRFGLLPIWMLIALMLVGAYFYLENPSLEEKS